MLVALSLERLSGQDAAFLRVESSTLFMHTLKLLLFRPLAGERPQEPDALARAVASRLLRYSVFRRRLVEVPLGLHHPVWVEDRGVDLSAHLRRARLARPDRAALDEVVASIAARPLERDRPLWELWALDGLAGDQVGVVLKLHHCLADGIAAMGVLTGALSPVRALEGSTPPSSVRAPSSKELVVAALNDHARQAARLPALVARTARRLVALGAQREPVHAPIPVLDAPLTSFNRPLSPRRSFASSTFPLESVQKIKTALGATVNDVVLGLVAGGVRHYLQSRGELPARPLIASVPMSDIGEGSAPRVAGNRLSNLFTTMATDIDDPAERLRVIHQVSELAKERSRALGVDLVTAWAEYFPPFLLGLERRIWGGPHLGGRVPPPINLVVSNVPGPREALAVPGWEVVAIHSGGPVLEGVGLNVTVWSYQGGLHVGVLACRESIPDPALITAGMAEALAELERHGAVRR